MKKILLTLLPLLILAFAIPPTTFGTTPETQPHAQVSSEKPIGAKAGQKEGIYTVGRAFKSAGGSMEKGFKTAGRGIKKGMVKTGHGFQKAGSSIKNFFTGDTGSKKTEGGK